MIHITKVVSVACINQHNIHFPSLSHLNEGISELKIVNRMCESLASFAIFKTPHSQFLLPFHNRFASSFCTSWCVLILFLCSRSALSKSTANQSSIYIYIYDPDH